MHQTDLGFTRLPYRPIVLLYNFGAANDEDGDDDDDDLDDAIVILIEANKIGCLLMTT